MKTVSNNTFRENRAKFPLAELQKFHGQWVAFSTDGQQIVANGGNISEVAERVRAAGLELPAVHIEHIEVDSPEIFLGAAELL